VTPHAVIDVGTNTIHLLVGYDIDASIVYLF
jgi:exopolyphosphatase/pppGpp-phosphohydrolase